MLRYRFVSAATVASITLLSTGQTAFAQGRGGGGSDGNPPTIEARTAGMQKIDGYFPLYWDERTGSLFLEIPRFDTDFLFSTGPVGRPRLERHRPRSRRRRRRTHRARSSASARACMLVQPQPVVPLEQREPARAQVGRGLVRASRCSGASRSRPRANGHVLVDATPISCCATCTGAGRRAASGHLPRRSHAQRVLPAATRGTSRRTPRST